MNAPPAQDLYPPIEPFESGRLAVDGRHSLYWEVCGRPDGEPVVFLHGGPGSGASPDHRRYFDPAKLELAKAVGASHLLDAKATNDLPAAVQDLTGGGAALSVDALGKPELCRDAILSLRRQGRHVQVGLLLGGDNAPPLPMDRVIAWELEIVGSHAMAGHSFGEMMALVEAGGLDPERLIGRRVSLAEGAQALERMDDFADVGVTMIERF